MPTILLMWYDDWKGADYRCLLHLQLLTVSGMWYGDVFIHLSSTFKLLANKRRKIIYINYHHNQSDKKMKPEYYCLIHVLHLSVTVINNYFYWTNKIWL